MTSTIVRRPEVRRVSYLLTLGLLAGLSAHARTGQGVTPGQEATSRREVTPAQEPAPRIDHGRAAALFEEARALEPANHWPGPLHGPILFVDPETRYAVANEADALGTLRAAEDVPGVFAGTLPDEVLVANTATSWAGQRWTMLVWPIPEGYFERRVLLGHELFHRLGPEIGLPMGNPVNEHLDTAEGRLWFRLELRALARALATSGSDRRAALTDAFVFRSRRHAEFPGGATEERALEINEGLAEYTGIHVALPVGARIGWTVREIESYEGRTARTGISRSFAYVTGPAYGLLLDAASPGWTRDVDEASDLGRLAAAAFGIELPDEGPSDLRSRMAGYGGVRLEEFERRREEAREREQAELRARYLDGPVLTLPVDDDFRYSFDPGAVTILEGVGRVLAASRVSAGWGRLDVTRGVLLRAADRGIVAVVVPAPADANAPPHSGDGWTLTLDDEWEVVPGERAGDWTVRRRP